MTAAASGAPTPTARPPRVTVDDDGVIYVDGERVGAVDSWLSDVEPQRLRAALAAEGCDVPDPQPSAEARQRVADLLDRLPDSSGIMVDCDDLRALLAASVVPDPQPDPPAPTSAIEQREFLRQLLRATLDHCTTWHGTCCPCDAGEDDFCVADAEDFLAVAGGAVAVPPPDEDEDRTPAQEALLAGFWVDDDGRLYKQEEPGESAELGRIEWNEDGEAIGGAATLNLAFEEARRAH